MQRVLQARRTRGMLKATSLVPAKMILSLTVKTWPVALSVRLGSPPRIESHQVRDPSYSSSEVAGASSACFYASAEQTNSITQDLLE